MDIAKVPKTFAALVHFLLKIVPEDDILFWNLEKLLKEFLDNPPPDSKIMGHWDHLQMTLYRSVYKGQIKWQREVAEVATIIFPFWDR